MDDGIRTSFFLGYGEGITLIGISGEDFEVGLRFDGAADINAVSRELYGEMQ